MSTPIEEAILTHGQGRASGTRRHRAETACLTALRIAGTRHIYADTADVEELDARLTDEKGRFPIEIDGNTANQPLVRRVAERYLDHDAGAPHAWASELRAHEPSLPRASLVALLYAILSGRIGNDMIRAYGGDPGWEVSLQLHMALCENADAARWVGRLLREMVPNAFVKVPFTPDAPHCLLVARDLERAGIPVNLTSTFSARQAVTGALLANVARTNIFMGRLNQGLEARLLGEHVDLEAQRALHRLRRDEGVKTQLIVASVREWESLVRVAGCDVFTAPCDVLAELIAHRELASDGIVSRLETSYEDELGVSAAVLSRLGPERIARLYRVEPELIDFLVELRGSAEYAKIEDGEVLHRRFEQAGFGDLFHQPSARQRGEIARSKLPEIDGELVDRIPLDTHYSLLANADFERAQHEIDAMIERRLDPIA